MISFVLATLCCGEGETPAVPQARNPFASDWLETGYQFDSREKRVLSFEGHSHPSEKVDVYGQLDLESSLDQDLSRWRGRFGMFGRCDAQAGVAFWYEDFNGSWNETARVGAYWDPALGGDDPFLRIVALPVATQDGGAMARAMFDVALRDRWSLAGFMEASWFGNDGDWLACEPELRYAIREGIWATLEYRRDDRQDENEGLALGIKGAL